MSESSKAAPLGLRHPQLGPKFTAGDKRRPRTCSAESELAALVLNAFWCCAATACASGDLDRLGRNLSQLIELVDGLKARAGGVSIRYRTD